MIRFFFYWSVASFAILSVLTAHASSLDGYKVEYSGMAPGCNISLQVPLRAVVTSNPQNRGSGSVTVENPRNLKSNEYIQPFYTGFICYPETDELTSFPTVRFDREKNAWIKDASAWEKEARESADLDHRKHVQRLIKTTFVYDIRAVNSQGWAMTQEDLIGDERNRRRMLHYCLFNPPKALCGQGEVAYLKDGRKGDLTGYALKILRSIEFLPDEPPAPETVSPDAPKTTP